MTEREYILPLSVGEPVQVTWYRVDKSFPKAGARVMVWGNGDTRFAYRDELDNWRGIHHGHMNGTPKYWAEIPRPSE